MNLGYQNERDFVEFFHNKYLNEFDEFSQKFLMDLFDHSILNDEKIISWKNSSNQKADFFIKYKKYVKGISLKCGKSNSIHSESIQDFKMFLESMHIPYSIIEKYVSYHYGYMKDERGYSDYSKPLSSYEYKEYYQSDIDEFNQYVNKTKIIMDMIDRYIIRGRNSEYDIDALISGTIDNYIYILKYDIYDLILSKRNEPCSSPHISCLTFGPKKRNLDGASNNRYDRYIVAVRWHFVHDDILHFEESNQ